MVMPGRKYQAAVGLYRYGFNGKENDNEVKGEGNQQDYGMRIYDPRIGKFLSVDPLTAEYPMLTPYQFASNRPIDGIDQDGLEWKPVNGANGNVTDYIWAGFNADGSPVAGSKPGGNIYNNGATYNYGSISVGDFHVGTFSVTDGSNIRGSSMISGNSASFSFDEVDENGRSTNTAFNSGHLGNAQGASGDQFASSLNSKFKDYENTSKPQPASGSIGDGYLPGEEFFGGGTLKAAGMLALKKVSAKLIIKKSLAAFGAAVVKKELTKDVVVSARGLVKSAGLPTSGKIRFIPRKVDVENGSLLRKDGGFVDNFGNVWKRPKGSNMQGEKHWDVILSLKGKKSMGHLSNSGKHVNVTNDGKLDH